MPYRFMPMSAGFGVGIGKRGVGGDWGVGEGMWAGVGGGGGRGGEGVTDKGSPWILNSMELTPGFSRVVYQGAPPPHSSPRPPAPPPPLYHTMSHNGKRWGGHTLTLSLRVC